MLADKKYTGTLYLIPTSLGSEDLGLFWPSKNTDFINSLNAFIVENIRTARRFLKTVGYSKSFDDVRFFLLNKHSNPLDVETFLQLCLEGTNTGLLSEAGCPCIADPGQVVVKKAHESGIRVMPLVGPSSIILALMGSGFNGQNFSFVGYLPIDKAERVKKIKLLESNATSNNQTQVFMETPFRNNQLIEALVNNLNPETKLCVACDITLPSQFIKTLSVTQWKKQMPDLNKRPSIFLLHTR